MDDTVSCFNCRQPFHDGVVVSFGSNIWHRDCFTCSRCSNSLYDTDTDMLSFLLLSPDGLPVCEACSCYCSSCRTAIQNSENVILTAHASFHVACFQCFKCHGPIDSLSYYTSTQGITCTACYNDLQENMEWLRDEIKRLNVMLSEKEDEVVRLRRDIMGKTKHDGTASKNGMVHNVAMKRSTSGMNQQQAVALASDVRTRLSVTGAVVDLRALTTAVSANHDTMNTGLKTLSVVTSEAPKKFWWKKKKPSPVQATSSGFVTAVTSPTSPKQKSLPIFGTELIQCVLNDANFVPFFVEKCVEAITRRGMAMEGIYRKSGSQHTQKSWISKLNNSPTSQEIDTFLQEEQDIHVIAGLLKYYFRELPNPLFPNDMSDGIIRYFRSTPSIDTLNVDIECLKNLLSQMPKANYETIKFLIRHLHAVDKMSQLNKMHAGNLAVVFAPNLIRSSSPEKELSDMFPKTHAVEWLIRHIDDVFTE